MTEYITLANNKEVTFVVLPARGSICIEVVKNRVYLSVDEWEHLIEVWQEYCSAAEQE